jgi:hypothetical protein
MTGHSARFRNRISKDVSRTKSHTVVVLSSEEQPKAGKEVGRDGGKRKGGRACPESRVRKY